MSGYSPQRDQVEGNLHFSFDYELALREIYEAVSFNPAELPLIRPPV